ncbi:MAG: hypothetical protein VXW65_07755 [Pseudomonadota bacterium]|nr:hypothetical protein [Pseudomonadota bacterium]
MNSIQTLNAAELDEVSGGTFGLLSFGFKLFSPCLPAPITCALAPAVALDTKLFEIEKAIITAPIKIVGGLLDGITSGGTCAPAPQPPCGC